MAILSHFLAALANDIRRAKTLTDFDTARQSTRFLKDDFLRLLPITRIDFDQIKLAFNMAVSDILYSEKDSPFLAALYKELEPKVKEAGLTKEALSAVVTEATFQTLAPELTEIDPSRFDELRETLSDRFGQYFTDRLSGKIEKVEPRRAWSLRIRPQIARRKLPEDRRIELSQIAKAEFVKSWNEYAGRYQEDLAGQLLKEIGRLDVVVEGDRLKEFPPDSLVRLELYLAPKTYHWSLRPEYVEKPEAPVEERFTLMPGG